MRPGLLLLIVVLNVRGEKLSVGKLASKVGVAKFVRLLLFWGKGDRNGFVKIITAPLIFNLFGVELIRGIFTYVCLLLKLRSTCSSSLLLPRLDYKSISDGTEFPIFCWCNSENNQYIYLELFNLCYIFFMKVTVFMR
jgi:hypothetical protein